MMDTRPRNTIPSNISSTMDVEPKQNKPKAVVYYPNWSIYARKYFPKDIPLDYVDHLIYGFVDLQLRSSVSGFYVPWFGDEYADVQKMFSSPEEGVLPLDGSKEEGGPLPYYGIVGQLKKLKKIKPGLKVGISIAGATMSTHMSDVCLTAESRAAFVMGSVALLKQFDVFDDFDIGTFLSA
jgi:chitinase